MNKRLFAVGCIIAIIVGALSSCGGGGDIGGGGGATVVTTTVGNATIQKTFQPNVTQFPDSAAISVLSPGVLQVASPPPGFGANSIFTWMDHPYVVTSVTPVSGSSAIVVATRDAAINEVLSQLTVTGDISINDADLTRMIVVTTDTQPAATPTAAATNAVQHATVTENTEGPCKIERGDPAQGGGTTASCTGTWPIPDVNGFVVTLTGGVKDLLFSGVRYNLKTGEQTIANTTFTAYINFAAQISAEPNKPGEFKTDWPKAQIKAPLPGALAFLSVSFTLAGSYSLPLYNVGVGVNWDFPYANGAFSYGGFALQTFSQQAATTPAYTNKTDDAFAGVKAGAELALTSLPLPLASVFGVSADTPLFNGRILAAGVFDIIGPYGSLNLTVTPPNACFRWDMAPRAQALVETTILGDPIVSISGAPVVLVPGVEFKGEAGCGSASVLVSANPTSIATGGSVALTANLTVPSGSPVPTGNVTFRDQSGAVLCSAVVMGSPGGAGCTATINTTASTDTITANYSGDPNYAPSSGTTGISIIQSGAIVFTSATCTIETPPPGPYPYSYFATLGITVSGTATGVAGSKLRVSSGNYDAEPLINPTCSAWTNNCLQQPGEPDTTAWTASYTTLELIDSLPPIDFPVLFQVFVSAPEVGDIASATYPQAQRIPCQ
ncbi:MAG TPA: Ig-like domain-containing protein [Paraburkholderia sp.]